MEELSGSTRARELSANVPCFCGCGISILSFCFSKNTGLTTLNFFTVVALRIDKDGQETSCACGAYPQTTASLAGLNPQASVIPDVTCGLLVK